MIGMMSRLHGLLILAFSFFAALPVSLAEAPEGSALPGAMEEEALFAPAVDSDTIPDIGFDAYERNVDDLFRLSLMTNPNPEFGINALIVNLNRRLIENADDTEALISLGHVYRMMGQPAEANRFYERALETAPDNFHLRVFSAKMLYLSEEVEKSLERIEKALELNPGDAGIWVVHAGLLLRFRREDEAITSFKKALEIEPKNETALLALSVLYQRRNEPDEALKMLNRLAELKPDDQLIKYQLGSLLFAQGRFEDALRLWEKLFYEGVRAPQFLFHLALGYLEAGEQAKAETLLNHLHFFFPRQIDIDFLLAETYRQIGRLGQAEDKYREIVALEPGYISARLGLALVLERQGKIEESQQLLAETQRQIAEQRARQALQPPADELPDVQTFLREQFAAQG